MGSNNVVPSVTVLGLKWPQGQVLVLSFMCHIVLVSYFVYVADLNKHKRFSYLDTLLGRAGR